jgi:hypothetical protein
MHVSPIRSASATAFGVARRTAALTLVCGLTALISSVPASAATVGPDAAQPLSVSSLAPAEVEQALAGVPLKGVSAAQLSEAISRLSGIGMLPAGPLREALEQALAGLQEKGDTLGQLSAPELIAQVQALVNGLLSPSQLNELSTLLGGESLSGALTKALGSLDVRQLLEQLLDSSIEPEKLLGQVLAGLSPETLSALTGSTLTGESVLRSTVGELASKLGMTPEVLAADLGTTSSELPASATALTAPLTDGRTLGVLEGAEGLDLGTLSGGTLGSGAGTRTGGGAGGSGGSGGSGAPGSTTMVLSSVPAQSSAAPGASAKPTLAKVRILSRKVKGDVVTLVVQVPAAGKLLVSGRGLKKLSRQVKKAERLTVRLGTTKAEASSLRKHRRRVSLELEASFTPVSGPSSATSTKVAFG